MTTFGNKMMGAIFAECRGGEPEVRAARRRKAAQEIYDAALAETKSERIATEAKRDFLNACAQGDAFNGMMNAIFNGGEIRS